MKFAVILLATRGHVLTFYILIVRSNNYGGIMKCDTKEEAAKGALELVEQISSNFDIIGLGTGSTIKKFMSYARSILSTKKIISSSHSTTMFLSSLGIDSIKMPRKMGEYLYIDGADEFTIKGDLIKGHGGALLGEKILAFSSKINVFIVGEEKRVEKLGEKKPLPIEIIPDSYPFVSNVLRLRNFSFTLRQSNAKDGPVISDWGGFLLDINTGPIKDPEKINSMLISIPGVVETGMFLGYADYIVIGKEDCGYEVIKTKRRAGLLGL